MADKEEKEQNTEDSVEERVVQKLKKVITIKKELSDKQKAHIEKLGKAKKGKKYVQQVEAKEVELPVEIKTKKPRAPRVKVVEPESSEEESSEPEVIVVKKKKKKQIIVEESESEEEEPVKVKRKAPVKAKPKPKVKQAPKPKVKALTTQIQEEPSSYFKKKLF